MTLSFHRGSRAAVPRAVRRRAERVLGGAEAVWTEEFLENAGSSNSFPFQATSTMWAEFFRPAASLQPRRPSAVTFIAQWGCLLAPVSQIPKYKLSLRAGNQITSPSPSHQPFPRLELRARELLTRNPSAITVFVGPASLHPQDVCFQLQGDFRPLAFLLLTHDCIYLQGIDPSDAQLSFLRA